jgi:6-phosphogluconolactonase (cycloisomerase 2 family)
VTLSSTVNTRPGHFPVDLVWGPGQSTVFALTDTGLDVSLIHIYVRDPKKGNLTEAADSPLYLPNVVQTASLATRRLLLALTESPITSELNIYSVSGDGKLTPVAGSPYRFQSSARATAFAVHPEGKWIAAVSTPGNTGAVISIYRFTSDNRISGATSLLLPCAQTCKVTSLTFDASGKFLYLSDAAQNHIIGLAFDPEKAALKPISGSPWSTGDQPHSLLVVEPR